MEFGESIENTEKYFELTEQLFDNFPGIKVTTLGEMVKSITLSASVRSGDTSKLDTTTEYYEVGLRDIDDRGVITTELCKNKKLGEANSALIKKYALKENDLLIPYRASRRMKIARMGKNYDLPVVSNVSVIRIEMYEDTPTELAILLQAYLSIDYVQEFLLPSEVYSSKKPFSRHLISTQLLLELPIPAFTSEMLVEGRFSDLYIQNIEINNKIIRMNTELKRLRILFAKKEEETMALYFQKREQVSTTIEKDSSTLKKLNQLLEQLDEIKVDTGSTRI